MASVPRVTLALWIAFIGCNEEAPVDTGAFSYASESESEASYYALHVGGVCSENWESGKGSGALGVFDGVTSISAAIDQRDSMSTATAQAKELLDEYCTDDNWCYIFTYSNGGAVVSRTLSLFATDWNVIWVMNSASNEGGSEIGGTGWVGETFGGCSLTGHIGTSSHRAGWNHNDTGGATFYMVGGYSSMVPWVQSWFLPGEDDGAVAYHSAGGYNDTYSTSTLCGADEYRYANHVPAYSCDGYALNHIEMKAKGVCLAGGC